MGLISYSLKRVLHSVLEQEGVLCTQVSIKVLFFVGLVQRHMNVVQFTNGETVARRTVWGYALSHPIRELGYISSIVSGIVESKAHLLNLIRLICLKLDHVVGVHLDVGVVVTVSIPCLVSVLKHRHDINTFLDRWDGELDFLSWLDHGAISTHKHTICIVRIIFGDVVGDREERCVVAYRNSEVELVVFLVFFWEFCWVKVNNTGCGIVGAIVVICRIVQIEVAFEITAWCSEEHLVVVVGYGDDQVIIFCQIYLVVIIAMGHRRKFSCHFFVGYELFWLTLVNEYSPNWLVEDDVEIEEAREHNFRYLEVCFCICVVKFAIVCSWPRSIVRCVHEPVRLHVDCAVVADRDEDVEVLGPVIKRSQLRGEFLVLL